MGSKRRYSWLLIPVLVAGLLITGGPRASGAPGDLDTSFGGDGRVVTDLGTLNESIRGMVRQSDGKIVAVGYRGDDFAVLRYMEDGSLDSTFADDGSTTVDVSGVGIAKAVAVQPDGKIVVAGASQTEQEFAVVRLHADGDPDLTFDGDGKTAPLSCAPGTLVGSAEAVAVLGDGKIMLGGWCSVGVELQQFTLVRLNPDGSLDASFGGVAPAPPGVVFTSITPGQNDRANDMAVQPDGKIVLAGLSTNTGNFAAARYTASGVLDPTFDGDGKVITSMVAGTDLANSVAVQPDGKIILAGEADTGTTSPDKDFALVRYNVDGSLDTTFDGDGMVTTAFGPAGPSEWAESVLLLPDGRIAAVGFVAGTGGKFGLARYTTAGALDLTFSGDGKMTDAYGEDSSTALAAVADPLGRVTVGGHLGSGADLGLARVLGDPVLSVDDVIVTEGGGAQFSITASNAPATDITFQITTADGTAVSPGDYAFTTHFGTIPAGQTSTDLNVSTQEDDVHEPAETFVVNITNVSSNAILGDEQGEATIIDDDPIPSLSVSDVSATEGGSAQVTISASNPSSSDIFFQATTTDGTATSPDDYTTTTMAPGMIPMGQTTTTMSVPTIQDVVHEGPETFTVDISNPSSNAVIGGAQGVVTIDDDEATPSLTIGNAKRKEGAKGRRPLMTFTVSLTGATALATSVSYATADGSVKPKAVAPRDYVATSGTLTFAPGETTKTITVTLKGDNVVEPREKFVVNLSAPTNATIADAQGVGTIINDD